MDFHSTLEGPIFVPQVGYIFREYINADRTEWKSSRVYLTEETCAKVMRERTEELYR